MKRTLLALALLAAACSGTGSDPTTTTSAPAVPDATSSTTTTPEATTATTTVAASTTSTTSAPDSTTTTTTTEAAAPAIAIDGDTVTIVWSALAATPFYLLPDASAADPLYFIHTDPAVDGFYLGIEAYTTGYGSAWAGELGRYPIDCTPAGTGICVHFDPDGDGPEGNYGGDFLAAGELEFIQLDADGYEVIVHQITFSNGVTIAGPFTVSG